MAASYTVIISILYLAAGAFIFLMGLTILRIGRASTPTRATALILFFAGLGPILSATGIILQNTLKEGSVVFKTMVENFEYLWEFYFPSVLLFSLSFPKEKWVIRKLPLMGLILFSPYIFHLAMMIFGDSIMSVVTKLNKGFTLDRDIPIGSGDFTLTGVNKILHAVILSLLQVHRELFSFVNIVYSTLAILFLAVSLRKLLNPRISRQLQTVLAGLVLSITAYSLTKLFSALFGEAIPRDASLALINFSLIAGGGTVAYVVVKHQFLGIRHVVRRSILYSGVAIIFAALYLVVVKPVSDFFGRYSMVSKEAFETSVIILTIIAFQPMLIRIEEVLGKILLKGRDDTGRRFRDLGGEISNVTSVDELRGVLNRGLRDILDASAVKLTMNGAEERERSLIGILEMIGEPVTRQELLRLKEKSQAARKRSDGMRAALRMKSREKVPEVTSEIFDSLGDYEVFVPIFKERRCIGYISVGEKIYGVRYSVEELAHLSVLSNQIGVAIDNVRLVAENVERKVIEEELKIARRIQRQLLPREAPVIKGYDLSGITVPSRHVAGDYYDFVLLNGGDSLALVVADVSGKGIPASLLTATLHAAIRSNEDAQKSPEAIISRVNALLHRSTSPEEFATLFYGVVDLSTGELRYANAGHDFPFLLWRDGASMLSESGIVLGCLEQYPYLEVACGIPEGGVLVLYTDGLTDCESAKGENFGTERLRRVLEANVGGSAKEICRAVLDNVRLFSKGGESLDDMTMLVLKRCQAPGHSD